MELTQLFQIDRRGRPSHEIDRICGLGKRNHFTNRRLAAEDRDDTVEPERNAAVRRGAVLERLEEEAKPELRVLFRNPERAEDPRLDCRAVDSDAAAANLRAVEHQV